MTFDKPLILNCAKLINELYLGGVAPTITRTETDTQVLVEEISPRRYGITFPGTDGLRDLWTDLQFRKTKWPPGCAHVGFTKAFRSVVDAIQDRIPWGSRVIIGGHSLGGALATECADAFDECYQIESVITFGSPRVFNGAAARNYNDRLANKTFRVWNSGDGVPCVPPPLPILTTGIYTHVRREFYLNADGGVSCEPSSLVHISEALKVIRNPAAALLKIDHSITSYIEKLEALPL